MKKTSYCTLEAINMQAKVLPSELDGKTRTPPTSPKFWSIKTPMTILLLVAGLIAMSMYVDGFFQIRNSSSRAGYSFLPCISEEKKITVRPPPPRPEPTPQVEEINDLSHWIRPPANLTHNMTEKEILWRASFMPLVEEYPFERVPKVAFLFLTRGPMPFSPLWELFFKGHQGLYSIYVHPAPDYKGSFPANSVFYQRNIPSKRVQWSSLSMIDAERRLLANAMLDIFNERFILLSESCIPVYNFTTVYNYLINSPQGFVDSFDKDSGDARGRYKPGMAPVVNVSEWRKGAQWFEMNRKLAAILIKDSIVYNRFKEFMRGAEDEHYVPTTFNMEVPELVANRSVTWTDWTKWGFGPHPATYRKENMTEALMIQIREGEECTYNGNRTRVCYLFARKFAIDTLDTLLQYAPKLLGFG